MSEILTLSVPAAVDDSTPICADADDGTRQVPLTPFSDLYACYSTSPAIITAIERISGATLLVPGSDAQRMWARPSQEEIARVLALAWAIDDLESALAGNDTAAGLWWNGLQSRPPTA